MVQTSSPTSTDPRALDFKTGIEEILRIDMKHQDLATRLIDSDAHHLLVGSEAPIVSWTDTSDRLIALGLWDMDGQPTLLGARVRDELLLRGDLKPLTLEVLIEFRNDCEATGDHDMAILSQSMITGEAQPQIVTDVIQAINDGWGGSHVRYYLDRSKLGAK